MMFTVEGDASSILIAGLGVALICFVMAKLLDANRSADRVLLGAVTGLAVINYAAWRTFDTLPNFAFTVSALWSYLFYVFEMLAIAYSLGSIVILFRAKDRTAEFDAAEIRHRDASDYPPVDIFICTYNEPINVLEKSIVTALALDYPNHTVFVCDDTRRDDVRAYCAEVGAEYVTRPDNTHAKAGNLNNALRTTADGRVGAPLILVLDADFAPQKHFLKRVIGLFDDSKVGVVQTPQFYFNCDPIQNNLGLRDHFVDDQRVFFDTFQPAKDAVDCAFCVGTGFVVRRDLVTEMGGFPHDALSEDMLLTYRLMERGYVTRWLNERLAVGLSAEGLPEYITQRTRWCLGTIQIGLLKDGPMRGGHFTLVQRLHYLHGLLSWLAKPFIVLMMLAPPLYWFFDLPAFQADHLAFLTFGLPALASFWIYSTWVSEGRTLPLFTEVTHALTALPVTMTLIQSLHSPFGKPFKVTEKGGDHKGVRVHVAMASIFGGLALASAAAIVMTLYGPDAQVDPSDRDTFNLVWAGVAMVTAFIAFVVCFDRPRDGAEELIRMNGSVAVAGSTGTSFTMPLSRLSVDRAVLMEDDAVRRKHGMVDFGKGSVLILPNVGPVACRSDPDWPGSLLLSATREQRRAMIVLLFSEANENVARTGVIGPALLATVRKAFAD